MPDIEDIVRDVLIRPSADVFRTAVVSATMWNCIRDCLEDAIQLKTCVNQILVVLEVSADSHHTAADIHTHCCGHHSAHGRDNRPNGRAHAPVTVAHCCNIRFDEGHRGYFIELLQCGVFNRDVFIPRSEEH